MSTLSSVLPANSTTGTSTVTNPNGFQSLTPADFIQMMVTQLQNQDPLDPTNSQDILAQMSQIGQLQSSTQLQSTLTGLTLQNQIGSASSLIGKTVKGSDANNNPVTGTVTSVTITPATAANAAAGQTSPTVTLNLDSGGSMPLANVTSIAPSASLQTAVTSALTNGVTGVPPVPITTPPTSTVPPGSPGSLTS